MAPYQKMMLKADINRIYDEKVAEKKSAKSKNIKRPHKKVKNGWFAIGMGIDLPFCIIILVLLTIGIIMMFSASYPVAY